MNEEELKKEINRLRNYWGNIVFVNKMDVPIDKDNEWIVKNFGLFCFQEGKLEQKKEELKFLKERCIYCMIADERIKQLQKEIGEKK